MGYVETENVDSVQTFRFMLHYADTIVGKKSLIFNGRDQHDNNIILVYHVYSNVQCTRKH